MKAPDWRGTRVGVAGAGIAGTLLAWRLRRAGALVSLYDPAPDESAGRAAGGMLAPYSELETGDLRSFRAGLASLRLWQKFVALHGPAGYCRRGGLLVAHPLDRGLWEDAVSKTRAGTPRGWKIVEGAELYNIEPSLKGRFERGLFFEEEAYIDPRRLLNALDVAPERRAVWSLRPGVLIFEEGVEKRFDWVFDCRGLGSKERFPELRGVRGEAVLVVSRELRLSRPIRLVHPRYRVYIVPRGEGRFYIGATSIESEDAGPITVRSLLELLSAAFAVDPRFGEACVIESIVDLRPSLPESLPVVVTVPGLTAINGLYRHGVLMAPYLIEHALRGENFNEHSLERKNDGIPV